MLMKSLRFRTLFIALVALATAFLLPSFAMPDARSQQNMVPEVPVSQESTQLELVIAGPEAVPLPRKHWRPLFTAVLINHSKEPVVFVPPRNDWYGERRLEWQAADSKGRWLDRQPNYAIECDVHGVMRAVPDLPAPLLDTHTPKQIREGHLIVLQPGEKYELKSLADPWFSLSFRRHGVFTLSLHFSLASEHYALPKNSPYAKTLKNSSDIEVSSNELTLTIN
jgi:hypothetical protein